MENILTGLLCSVLILCALVYTVVLFFTVKTDKAEDLAISLFRSRKDSYAAFYMAMRFQELREHLCWFFGHAWAHPEHMTTVCRRCGIMPGEPGERGLHILSVFERGK